MQSSITSFLFYLDERLFTHIANDLNQLVTNLFRFLHRVSFGINTDNRFRIALTQMHPFFREVDLHTIDIGDIILGKFLFYFCQDSIYIDIWSQFYFLLGNEVRRSLVFICFFAR